MPQKLTHEAAQRVAKKISLMKTEQSDKPEEKRRSDDQIYAIAYQMERDGKL